MEPRKLKRKEIFELAGLSASRFDAWYDRGHLPYGSEAGYNTFSLLRLAAMVELVDTLGLPPAQAARACDFGPQPHEVDAIFQAAFAISAGVEVERFITLSGSDVDVMRIQTDWTAIALRLIKRGFELRYPAYRFAANREIF